MEVEIEPEPDDSERQAILAALDGGADAASPYASVWRRVALEEARGADADAGPP